MYTLSFEANFGKVFEDFTWIQLYWQFLSSLVFFVKSKMSSGKITILFRFFRFFSWNHPKKTFLQFPNCKNSVKSNDLFLTVWKLLTESQCGNYVNSFSYFFGKNFVKAKVLIKLLNSWFHGIFWAWLQFLEMFLLLWFYVKSILADFKEKLPFYRVSGFHFWLYVSLVLEIKAC